VLRHQLAPLFKKQPLQRQLATWAVQWAKARVRDRENLRFERTRVFGYARQIFLAMGQRLWAEHLLEQPRDIFLLTVDEVLALAEGMATVADPRPLIAQRKAERAHCNRLPAPPNRLTSDDVKAAWFTPTGAWTSAPAQQHIQGAAEQRGIGCSAGVVRAPVRVVKDPRTTSLQPGEIMVARFTDPGWITLFANAAGILVERGSLLSHSAIVARELGIPAIVAIDGVMAWLQTGDMVEMDGATGRVCKV
jgi:pyruvate,water dikinase